jgi:hypothetical protein
VRLPAPSDYAILLCPLCAGGWRRDLAVVSDLPGCLADGDTPERAFTNAHDAIVSWISHRGGVGQMVEKFASPQVLIRRYAASEICDVVVSVRGREVVLRCSNYSQALKWARLECNSYKIPEPDIEPLSGPDHDELPLFLRSPETNE